MKTIDRDVVSKAVRESGRSGVKSRPLQLTKGGRRRQDEIRIPKTAEIVAGHIRRQIILGELSAGDSLPTEAQLMEQFSTSRPSIREAFRILESEQFISVKRGARSGAQVHLPTAEMVARYAGYVLQAQGTNLKDLYLTRCAIEPFAARLLAESGDNERVRSLSDAVDQVEEAFYSGDGYDFRYATVEFHLHLVKLSGNNTLTLVITMLEEVFRSFQLSVDSPAAVADQSEEQRVERAKRFIKSLRRLLGYVSEGNGDEAERHWRAHTVAVNKLWMAGFSDKSIVEVLS